MFKIKISKKEMMYLFFIFLVMFTWAVLQSYNYAPDEQMRYKIPLYIFNHGKLPLPDAKEIIEESFNASYGYYPLYFGAIMSALFMKIFSFFSTNFNFILIGARMTSVISGTLFVYFLIKISHLLFKSKKSKYLFILLGSLVPQFIFLSSYVNNDIVALMSSSMIVYSWILGYKDGWNYKNSTLLSIGIIICALSYYNAYAWILLSVIIFISSFIKEKNYKEMFKYGLFIAGLVLLFISFFFIRNFIINKGDLLGMKSFMAACEEGAIDMWKPSLRNTAKNLNMSYIEMIFSTKWTNHTWIEYTYKSFIGCFGYMQYWLHNNIYKFYKLLFVIGMFGYLIKFKDFIKDRKKLIFNISLILCMIISVLLSLKYSYETDYQAQGRYIYPIFISLIIGTTYGIETLLNLSFGLIRNDKIKNIIFKVIYTCLYIAIIVCFILATKTYISSLVL